MNSRSAHTLHVNYIFIHSSGELLIHRDYFSHLFSARSEYFFFAMLFSVVTKKSLGKEHDKKIFSIPRLTAFAVSATTKCKSETMKCFIFPYTYKISSFFQYNHCQMSNTGPAAMSISRRILFLRISEAALTKPADDWHHTRQRTQINTLWTMAASFVLIHN